jgi:hypothetical protein
MPFTRYCQERGRFLQFTPSIPPHDNPSNRKKDRAMNTTSLKYRITRFISSLGGATLITFAGLQLISNYALPEGGQSDQATQVAKVTQAATRMASSDQQSAQ